MKAYIAGKIGTEEERKSLEDIDRLCKSLNIKTFLPHRDVGLAKGIGDVKRIFREDIIKGFRDCGIVIAMLDGLHVGAGTSWELGYAYANKIPAIGIKTDESPEKALEYLSAILIGSMPIVASINELKAKLKETMGKHNKR